MLNGRIQLFDEEIIKSSCIEYSVAPLKFASSDLALWLSPGVYLE